MKKDYKDVVNSVITGLEDNFGGLSKREVINMVFEHINTNGLIKDYKETSLYNSIYYFLRKRNIFKTEEIRYRFDSISSKIRFIDNISADLSERWWFYHDLFFGDIDRPVLDSKPKVLSGSLNYIIESKRGPQFDFLYTLWHFRDSRKILSSDVSNIFVKKELNEHLYGIFDNLYELDNEICQMILDLNESQLEVFKSLIVRFFRYLSDFDTENLNGLHTFMVKNVNAFKKFVQSTGHGKILDYNKNRFFDTITFCNTVYACALQYLDELGEFEQYRSIHYLINSTSYFVFFKFAKRLKNVHFNRLTDFFSSDLYFSYTSYLIKYYELFSKNAGGILQSGGYNPKSVLSHFDIILRYMLYNKTRNLINSNIKRFVGCEFDICDGTFLEMDDVNDCELFNCNIFYNPEPCSEVTTAVFNRSLEDFFFKHSNLNRDDVTSIAIELCNGCYDLKKYTPAEIAAGRELVTILRENV